MRGPCWEEEELEADPPRTCPLEDQCGELYDCSDDPIIIFKGNLLTEGETEGETEGSVPWTGEEQLWTCDEPVGGKLDGPDEVRL